MNEADQRPQTQSSAAGGPPPPPKVTAAGVEGGDDGEPDGEISPELMLEYLRGIGWVTDDELAAVRADPEFTAQKALDRLLREGTINEKQIRSIRTSYAQTEYIGLGDIWKNQS